MFNLPTQTYLLDSANFTCKFLIEKSPNANGSYGAPFFRNFYTLYDVATRQIGFSMAAGRLGFITFS